MQTIDEIKNAIERSLAPDVVDMLRRNGLRLTLGSSEATIPLGAPIPSPPIVAVDQGLAEQLAQEEELTARMVTYRKRTTGVDNRIFVSAKFPRHIARIKVAIDPPTHLDRFGDNASVAIEDGRVLEGELPSRVHKQVIEFLNLNRLALLDYWEQRIDDELKERLRPIP